MIPKPLSKDIYVHSVLNQISRILGLLDRDVSSPTYGCFDRQHWNYAISDIAQARKQESVLTLMLLYKLNIPQNPYFKNQQIKNWIISALEFWSHIQQKDGSFNDLYPHEGSFVATAFSSYAISETLLEAQDQFDIDDIIITHLEKAALWLKGKQQHLVRNQDCGSIALFYNLYLLTKKDEFKKWAYDKFAIIIKDQNEEGWLNEYGSADIGYLSVAIDYISKYYKKSADDTAYKFLKKAINFIQYFVHPNSTFGGHYGSRNTAYLLPHGFEFLSATMSEARTIAYSIRESLLKKSSIDPSSLDDKYLLFMSYTYLQAYIDGKDDLTITQSLYDQDINKLFTQCGLIIHNSANFYIIVNGFKGGALDIICHKNKSSITDSGIIIKNTKGRTISSSHLCKENNISFRDNSISISGPLWFVSQPRINSLKNILLHGFQLTIGRNPFISSIIKKMLRNILLFSGKKSSQSFSRKIMIENDKIHIIDEIENSINIAKIILGSKSSFIYGESAHYYQSSDLKLDPLYIAPHKNGNPLTKQKISITRTFDNKGCCINHSHN
ncbi:MAG: hypothetical protein ACFFDN_18910 [Candidatus Hodarchaeota archaeon]